MQCNITPCNDMSQNTQYSLNRIYRILLGNTSSVHDPWGTREVHIPTRTISTHYHNIKKFSHGRSPRAQITILTSHHPQHGRSPRSQLILSLISMHVHNIVSIEGMMMNLNQSI